MSFHFPNKYGDIAFYNRSDTIHHHHTLHFSGILVCEFYFEQLPTTANRKQVVVADLVFSGQPSLKVGIMTLITVFQGYSLSCSLSPSLASPISGVSAKSPGVTMAALISGQP